MSDPQLPADGTSPIWLRVVHWSQHAYRSAQPVLLGGAIAVGFALGCGVA